MRQKSISSFVLSAARDELWNADGIHIKDLKIGDVLTVVTNNTYYFRILDSRGNALVTSNGPHITEPTVRKITGATFGGSIIRPDWVLLGYRLELSRYLELNRMVLGRVRSICLNGSQLIPSEKTTR